MTTITKAAIRALRPCQERWRAVSPKLGDGPLTFADIRAAGATFDDMLWLASALARTDQDIERRLRLCLADYAARVLHVFERDYPTDARPRRAIEAFRAFARGEIDDAAWDAAGAAAWDVAGDAAEAAAGAAAWDVAWDVAWDAAGAAAGAAAWDDDVAWDVAWDAAGAAARAAAGDAGDAEDAEDAEKAWQYDRLIERLMGEPEDWPLPEVPPQQRSAA